MPKTAGSSFRITLAKHYGDRLLLDYADYPIHTPAKLRNRKALQDASSNEIRHFNNFDCIHGHFLPVKYLPLKQHGAKFVTWLREPLARMVSHYNFWFRTYDSVSSQHLHRRVVEEKWSLERFCFSLEMKNFYSQFLWSFPLEHFDFVGITEHFSKDLECFSRQFLGNTFSDEPRENIAPSDTSDTPLPNPLRERFMNFHSEDYGIYFWARTKSEQRHSPLGRTK